MDRIETKREHNKSNRYVPAWLLGVLVAAVGLCSMMAAPPPENGPFVLKAESFRRYVQSFNANDDNLYPPYIADGAAWDFLKSNIPLFECPDKDIEEIYYFRWWTYRKHIKLTPDVFIITEFLPNVPWAGKDGSIDCATGQHLYEGRWLADPKYLDDYSRFWFRKGGGDPRNYSTWLADALWARYLVNGDTNVIVELLPALVRNFEGWEKSHLGANGLFSQSDDRDGMEMSISGDGYRPTINSYMYGDAVAIAEIARLAGQPEIASRFRARADRLKQAIQEKLWSPGAQFFEVLKQDGILANVREQLGYTPWYFNLPDGKAVAWKQLMDPKGFFAPFGPTTVEQRSPRFTLAYSCHECQWNGPSWPYATSITLTAMANLLDNDRQDVVNRRDYFELLKIYTKSQHLRLPDGKTVPWIDEDLDPYTGVWIARKVLGPGGSGIPERGKDYNHSTYCDLIITGLVGLRPRKDNIVEVDPLVPDGAWNYFCLDNVHYHGHTLTIFYDKTGEHYDKGKGLQILEDGQEIGSSRSLRRVRAALRVANPR